MIQRALPLATEVSTTLLPVVNSCYKGEGGEGERGGGGERGREGGGREGGEGGERGGRGEWGEDRRGQHVLLFKSHNE